METVQVGSRFRKIALIGNHLPRRCGIATFTTDLLSSLVSENPSGEHFAVVMNDVSGEIQYPSQVRFEVHQRRLSDYRLAADFINLNRVDVVCLQHEFGIFGGENGSHILDLLRRLRMPVVSTLHTVMQMPTDGQKVMIRSIAQLSDRLVVMSRKAEELLRSVYGVEPEKIMVIHHGIPDVPFVDPNYHKDQYGVVGREVILTFGLLSPGKGIETMIEALPAIAREHPQVVYIVLGATHPQVKREQGEAYRLSLQRRARELGVTDNLIFHNRFVEQKELCDFLGATDIYVTPYLNREQIVSGTLAYALGSGKATVSTPSWYAEEMLAEGRGCLVPFRDPAAMAAAINQLLSNEVERLAMRKRAYKFCRGMVWKEVARTYLGVFSTVKREWDSRPRPVVRSRTAESLLLEIPQANLDHIQNLTDDVGILQHAKFIVPNRAHGYCTDDNARALMAVLMAGNMFAETKVITRLASTYLGFLDYAFNEESGRFRNFMGYNRCWLEDVGSEDSHGRAVWGLGQAVALAESESLRAAARNLFEQALPVLPDFSSPRAWAFALVGIHAYLGRFGGDSQVVQIRNILADKLFRLHQGHADVAWPWFEDRLTYANGILPHALILSGRSQKQDSILDAGLHSLEWLLEIQTDPKGHLVPIGNKGWYVQGAEKPRFDQQPIEVLHLIEACREAYEATGDSHWLTEAQVCLEWFLGRNDLNVPLYDHRSSGCCDGLQADGPNRNQGAESTLVCFLSLLTMNNLCGRQITFEATAIADHQDRPEVEVQ